MGHFAARISITATLAAVLALPGHAANSTWQIDPNHSAAQFAVRHLTISTVRGAFTKASGTVQLDDKDIAKSSVDVTIDAASVDTRVPDRDNDLRSDHSFDVAKYPTITFKSKRLEQLGAGKLRITGDLTIHGTTKEVALDVDGPTRPVKDPWGSKRAAAMATTKINRQNFRAKWTATMATDRRFVHPTLTLTLHPAR